MLHPARPTTFRPVLRPKPLVLGIALYVLGTAVGVWAVGVGARHTGELALDRTIAADRGTFVVDVSRVINVVFGPVVGPLWAVLLCVVVWRTLGRVVALRAGLTALVAWLSVEVWKLIFRRDRPPTDAVHALVVETKPDSFPSGHTAFATALVVAFAVALGAGHRTLRRVVLLGGIPLIVVVAASRLVLGAHYLADVCAAPILVCGTIAGMIGLGLVGPDEGPGGGDTADHESAAGRGRSAARAAR
ncbi:phosphatase PAP2 family protein [Flexivirga sp. B27]